MLLIQLVGKLTNRDKTSADLRNDIFCSLDGQKVPLTGNSHEGNQR